MIVIPIPAEIMAPVLIRIMTIPVPVYQGENMIELYDTRACNVWSVSSLTGSKLRPWDSKIAQ